MPQTSPTPPILITPVAAALPVGGGTLDLIVRVQAHDQPADHSAQHRPSPPKRLALVVDRSGSMSGSPLADAKKVIGQIINGLRPQDRVAVVAYDDEVSIVQTLTHCEQPGQIIERINAIQTGGSTNLFGGWEAAAELLLASPGDGLNRVIVISDGCLNAGLTDPVAICDRVGLAATRGVTTSTQVLSSHFHETVSAALADAGRGPSHQGTTSSPLLAHFHGEI